MNVQRTCGGVADPFATLVLVVGVLTLGNGCADSKDTTTVQNAGDTVPTDTLPATDENKNDTSKTGETPNSPQPGAETPAGRRQRESAVSS